MFLTVIGCRQHDYRLNKGAPWEVLGNLNGVKNLYAIGGLSKVEGHLLHTPLYHIFQTNMKPCFFQSWDARNLILGSIKEHHGECLVT